MHVVRDCKLPDLVTKKYMTIASARMQNGSEILHVCITAAMDVAGHRICADDTLVIIRWMHEPRADISAADRISIYLYI